MKPRIPKIAGIAAALIAISGFDAGIVKALEADDYAPDQRSPNQDDLDRVAKAEARRKRRGVTRRANS